MDSPFDDEFNFDAPQRADLTEDGDADECGCPVDNSDGTSPLARHRF